MSNARVHLILRHGKSREEAWKENLSWLESKKIGLSQSTDSYTVAELQQMGFVGVYQGVEK